MKIATALLSVPVAMALCGTVAAEEIPTTILQETSEGGSSVSFEYGSCGGECFLADLSCNSDGGNLEFRFIDVDSESASMVVASEQQRFQLILSGKSFGFTAYHLMYQEMTGSWAVTGYVEHGTEGFLPALAKSKSILAEIGKKKLDLPVTGDVTSWVKKCGG